MFLEGFVNEKLLNNKNALDLYESFINISSQKYSARYRGYRDADTNDIMFLSEKKYAQNYLYNFSNDDFVFSETVINLFPKYYYSSFCPGFTFNNEDFARKNIGSIMFIIGEKNLNYYFGVQYFSTFNQNFCINPRISYSYNLINIGITLPFQVYKDISNKYGIKCSPFIKYYKIDSLLSENKIYYENVDLINYGFKLSCGYYIIPKIMLGAYYEYNFYNEKNKFKLHNNNLIWFDNTYDISIYYNLIKSLNLKAGICNNIFQIGVIISGFESGFGVNNKQLYFNTDLY